MAELPSAAVADLLRLPTDAARRQHLHDQGLADAEGLSWLLDRAQDLVHDDPEAASELARLGDDAAVELAFAPLSARARYLLARVSAERGEPDRALGLIEQARGLWWSEGMRLQALRTDLGQMQILDDLGRHADALATGRALLEALDALEGIGTGDPDTTTLDPEDRELRDWLRAAALENTGVAYGFVGEHERALEAYAQAEHSYRELGLEEETARPRANRGIELLELGRAREARDVLQSAAQVFADTGDRLWSAKCLGHLAQALEQLGELRAALQVLEPARVTLEELGAEAEAARIRLAIAGVYLAVGLAEEARTEATSALDSALASGLTHDAATARHIIAQALLADGRLDPAAQEIRLAAALFAEVGDARGEARAGLAEAEIVAAQGHRAASVELAEAAATALEAGGWRVPLTWAELRLFDSAQPDGAGSDGAGSDGAGSDGAGSDGAGSDGAGSDGAGSDGAGSDGAGSDGAGAQRAVAHLDRATALADELGLPQLRYACAIRTAQLRRGQGRDAEAETLLRTAIDEAEQVGASLPGPEMRRAFRADRLAAYDDLIGLLLDRGEFRDAAEALRISDRSKDQALRDLRTGTVGEPRAPHRATNPTAAAQGDLASLRTDLNAVYGALTAGDPVRAPALRRRATELERRIKTLRARRVAGQADTAAASQSGDAPSLAPAGVALEYHVLGDDVIAFVRRAGTVRVERLSGVLPRVHVELDRLTAQWSRFRMGPAFAARHSERLVDTCRQILGALYRLLISPLGALTEPGGDHRVGELVIVPHRRLHQVPFHALHDGTGYLHDRLAITVAPSLSGAGARPMSLDRGMVVLALPDAHARSVADEAQALAVLLPDAHLLVGEAATTDALTRAAPGRGIVHLACHGLYRAANPLFSSIRLADRWMAAAEVLELDLDGALVTLSACESGRQGAATAEPVGLGWAFLAAGASGVVASQWVVDDEVTTSLMTDLYRELVAGRTPAEALRRAQQNTAGHHPHPFHWAPFAYVAQPRRS